MDLAKDASVVLCVFLYYLWREVMRLNVDPASYQTIYQNFLWLITDTNWRWNSNVSTKDHLRGFVDGQPHVTVLDFGCANGARLKDFIESQFSTAIGKFDVIGVDSNDEWAVPFNKELSDDLLPVRSKELYSGIGFQKWPVPREPIIAHLSHILYEDAERCAVASALKKLAPDSIVVIRGYAARSIFGMVANQKKDALWDPRFDLIWVKAHLQDLAAACNLVRLSTELGTIQDLQIPDAYVRQRIDITKEENVQALVALLEFLYGTAVRESTESYLKTLAAQDTREVISDDIVFVFRKAAQ